MVQLHIQRFGCTVTAVVPASLVEANTGYVPRVLGENLAGQIDAWVMESGLGYYPALEFFRDKPQAVDPALLQLVDEVAHFCSLFLERETRRRLAHAFSSVQVRQPRSMAYAMPHVRPTRGGAPSDLARHYMPSRVKADLLLSSVQKEPFDEEWRLTAQRIRRCLGDLFEELEIGRPRSIGPD